MTGLCQCNDSCQLTLHSRCDPLLLKLLLLLLGVFLMLLEPLHRLRPILCRTLYLLKYFFFRTAPEESKM